MNDLAPDPDLISAAREARERAYVPYSNFKMGAAVRTDGGTIIEGTLVENVSLGLAMCAERIALVRRRHRRSDTGGARVGVQAHRRRADLAVRCVPTGRAASSGVRTWSCTSAISRARRIRDRSRSCCRGVRSATARRAERTPVTAGAGCPGRASTRDPPPCGVGRSTGTRGAGDQMGDTIDNEACSPRASSTLPPWGSARGSPSTACSTSAVRSRGPRASASR